MSDAPAIELKGISKAFGPVQANKDISIRVMPGTIHGIIGENGAGKSTLMSILYGFYKADSGQIFINGKETTIPDSQAAIGAGIWYLEDMRKASAAERRAAEAAALEAARKSQQAQ